MPGTFGDIVVWDAAKLAEVLRSENGPVLRHVLELAERVKTRAKEKVGVHKPDPWGRPLDRAPGTLMDSIVKRVVVRGSGDPVVEVGSDDRIALWHHEGTQPHMIAARNAPKLIFWSGGSVVFAKVVSHPGTEPNRFLTEALDEVIS